MEKIWQEEYKKLQDFIDQHENIVINEKITLIDSSVRPIFYKLFDRVRNAFLINRFPNFIDQGEQLSSYYSRATQELHKSSGWDCVITKNELRDFLVNPAHGMIRPLFDPLFCLLKHQTSIKDFEYTASKMVERFFASQYMSSYEKWVIISLIRLLDCNQIFYIPIAKMNSTQIRQYTHSPREAVPFPKESTEIWLDYTPAPLFIIPSSVLYANKIQRYISITSEFVKPLAIATNPSENKEWFNFNDIYRKSKQLSIMPSLMIHMCDELNDTPIIADRERFYRPDMILEFGSNVRGSNYMSDVIEKMKLNREIFQPRLGSYFITTVQPDNQISNTLVSHDKVALSDIKISMLNVDFKIDKLTLIAEALSGTGSE